MNSTTVKFKSIWYSFFQAQNSMLIQKSIKHVDKYDNDNNKSKIKMTPNDSTTKTASALTTNTAFIKTNHKSILSSVSSSSSSSKCSTPTQSNTGLALFDDSDYRKKREKNNESVRKSRAKNRIKLQECASRVQELRNENTKLVSKLDNLQKELFTLRGLFEHCFLFNTQNMSFKPSDIPTSTLYKVIMENKSKFTSFNSNFLNTNSLIFEEQSEQQIAKQEYDLTMPQTLINSDLNLDTKFNDNDRFYIDQLKNSLINLVNYEDDVKLTMNPLSSSALNYETTSLSDILDDLTTNDDSSSQESSKNSDNFAIIDHDYSMKRFKFNI